MTSQESEFRQFALSVYAVDGVSSAALLLQDGTDSDVNVLLLAAYIGAVRGRAFRAQDLVAARRRTQRWNREVVRPLREIRTRLKTGPAPAPNSATDELREQVKALELAAELIEINELSLIPIDFEAPAATGKPADRAAEAMRSVVTVSAGRSPTPSENRAVATIAAAAGQFSEESE